ncbi:hypothetical protein [Rhodohalobacter sp. 614A]|uniref:hypothetical protein n=1 Tax=Rhodohalobacter sp. 614A TaxID=2908649 RepID=UPI001F4688AD|nr:hypothetical protein [Rhodohalobacter sp. 614A]
MPETKTVPMKSKKSQFNTDLELIEYLQRTLKNIHSVLEEHPEKDEVYLDRLSTVHKKLVSSDRFQTALFLGVMDFLERAKRRATRKPITLQKQQNLLDDLHSLVEVLKI